MKTLVSYNQFKTDDHMFATVQQEHKLHGVDNQDKLLDDI